MLPVRQNATPAFSPQRTPAMRRRTDPTLDPTPTPWRVRSARLRVATMTTRERDSVTTSLRPL